MALHILNNYWINTEISTLQDLDMGSNTFVGANKAVTSDYDIAVGTPKHIVHVRT